MNDSTLPDHEPLAGTVKAYRGHLAICTGGAPELWAARVEEMEGLFAALHQSLLSHGLEREIKLTACDAPSQGAEGFDIFHLPDMLVLPEVTVERVEPLVEALAARYERGLPFDVRPMAGGDHLFVCTHANRDERCGEWGPPFHAALVAEVEQQGAIAHVHQSSHIGGHRYAATCIIYPAGIWYGELKPEDAQRLVREHLEGEQLLADRYRGRLGATPCLQVAEAIAARVLRGAVERYEQLEVEVEEADGRAAAVARARVTVGGRRRELVARFTLSCPLIWWDADDEPVFLDERSTG